MLLVPKPCPTCRARVVAPGALALSVSGLGMQCLACCQPLRVAPAWHYGLSAVAVGSFAGAVVLSLAWRSWLPYLLCAVATAGFLAVTAACATPRPRLVTWKYESIVAWLGLGVFCTTFLLVAQMWR